ISALLNLAPLFAFDKIVRITPVVTRRASEFHLDDSYTGPIQEITIVADNDKSRRICLQKFFQPFDGAHVEMIRWLVQQQHVRFRKQQTGESQTILLSAGKFLG